MMMMTMMMMLLLMMMVMTMMMMLMMMMMVMMVRMRMMCSFTQTFIKVYTGQTLKHWSVHSRVTKHAVHSSTIQALSRANNVRKTQASGLEDFIVPPYRWPFNTSTSRIILI